tara:strand:- start:342 stop:611 length:270 start_codon:yes stop_codon:yes gene_type:complete
MIEVLNEDTVRNWFGNRGYPFDDDSKIKYKVLNIKGNRWIFIHDSKDEYDEVELYYMNTYYCEPYQYWSLKGFSWAKNNLTKLIKKIEE